MKSGELSEMPYGAPPAANSGRNEIRSSRSSLVCGERKIQIALGMCTAGARHRGGAQSVSSTLDAGREEEG